MTPKEKAIELVNKYYHKIEHTISNEYSKVTKQITKQCALITVSELIKENLRYDYIPFEGSRTEFYLQVEKELNKL